MSLDQVQARTAEITARIAMLRQGGPLASAARGVLGSTGVAPVATGTGTDDAFATLLAQAQKRGAPASATTVTATSLVSGATDPGLAEKVVASAREHLGVPYVWGGEDPSGFDCSGLMQYAFAKNGIDLPRVSQDQARAGREVPLSEVAPGDLVFYGSPVDHVGIYSGNGRMVVAPHTGAVVREQAVTPSKVTHVRRVLPGGPSSVTSPTTSTPPVAAGVVSTGSGGWRSTLPAAAGPYLDKIESAARSAGVSPALVAAVAWTESDFNPRATSPVGAQGIMQIMPGTARGLGVNALDPDQALLGGARYLADQLRTFGGRTDLALAAYNAGPGAVRKYDGIPPYPETQAYVRRVLDRMGTMGAAA